MRLVQLGESCLIIRELTRPAAEFAHSLNQAPPVGLHEAVPAFDQLALYFNPDLITPSELISLIEGSTANNNHLGPGQGMAALRDDSGNASEKLHIIPTIYSAPDLQEAANILNLTVEQLIHLHSEATYTVEAIGFCPGFPYLAGLHPKLQNLPRRSNPRTKVEPGTIAITGDQCCIYSLERPGGWNLIARTPLTLVDPEIDYFPLKTGDTIQFRPISQKEFDQLVGTEL